MPERERLGAWLPWVAGQTVEAQRAFLCSNDENLAAGRAYHAVIHVEGDTAGMISLFLDRTAVAGELGY